MHFSPVKIQVQVYLDVTVLPRVHFSPVNIQVQVYLDVTVLPRVHFSPVNIQVEVYLDVTVLPRLRSSLAGGARSSERLLGASGNSRTSRLEPVVLWGRGRLRPRCCCARAFKKA